MHSFILTAFL